MKNNFPGYFKVTDLKHQTKFIGQTQSLCKVQTQKKICL